MAQLDQDRYRRLTQPFVYGTDDGVFLDTTTNQVVVILGGTVVARADATGITADLEFTGEARGDLLRRGASGWEVVSKGAAYQKLQMDSDASDPEWGDDFLTASANLTPTTIVGDSAGDLGHADGVVLVAAVADKIIQPVAISINYTFGVAAYTDGGNITAGYKDGTAITGIISAANSLGAGADNVNLMFPVDGLALVNKALVLRSAAAFTNPGTATGTASVRAHYRLISLTGIE